MSFPSLLSRVPEPGQCDAGELIERFVDWVSECELSLYPAQEEAILEIMAGQHVVLNTPTGSGKSMVALAMHFKALSEGRRSFYTSPIKALATEKFFDLCHLFGPENVGLLTGDASINPDAKVMGCTQEVLANMSLRMGDAFSAPYVVMDEFHFYGDRDRGWAWQIPLLTLSGTQFLLMSATLGNTHELRSKLSEKTGRKAIEVRSQDRPVPLDFTYSERPLQDTVQALLRKGKSPIYVVNFTHRDCAERAQALTSIKVCDQAERRAIGKILAGVRFSSPYGKDVKRFLSAGIGVHFAGLLPKYRLLVEQLAQKGLLKVICGTDTLGVGVNIPIRTVLFTQLSKFDGEKVRVLRVRDFQQIAGRAGRKGFDEQGSVVAQAPDYVIENLKIEAKASGNVGGKTGGKMGGKKRPKKVMRKKPPPGFVGWSKKTFDQLVEGMPESLESQFRVTHGMMLSLLPREEEFETNDDEFLPLSECGYRRLVRLIHHSHSSERQKSRLRREAAVLFRALRNAGLVHIERDLISGRMRPFVPASFQYEFSLHQVLSLFLIEVIESLDREHPSYALDLLSAVEAILENPRVILMQQVRKEKDKLMAKMKAERVPYEERMEKMKKVTYPQPCADFLYAAYSVFSKNHPWVGQENIRPKGIAREMVEEYSTFDNFVRKLGVQRAEGVVLRYLSQVLQVLNQTVPEDARTEEVYDLLSYFGNIVETVDSSLMDEWELMKKRVGLSSDLDDEARAELAQLPAPEAVGTPDQARSALSHIRRGMHELLRALVNEDYEQMLSLLDSDPEDLWDARRFRAALTPFYQEHAEILFTPEARRSHATRIEVVKPGCWKVQQTLMDPEGDNFWFMEIEVTALSVKDNSAQRYRLKQLSS